MEYTLDIDALVKSQSGLGLTIHTLQRKLIAYINKICLTDSSTKSIISDPDLISVLCDIYGISLSTFEMKNIKRTEIIDNMISDSDFDDRYKVSSMGKYDIIVDYSINDKKIVFENEDGKSLNSLNIIDQQNLLI